MPTDRFCRLPEEKRRAICDAVRKEFARVPFEKASINQIIRNANISRGSFYTYFADKEDAVEYVLNEDFARMRAVCENALDVNGGEYLDMMKVLFEYLVQRMQSMGEIMDIVKNVFPHANHQLFSELTVETASDIIKGKDGTAGHQWMISRMDKEHLRIQTPEELQALVFLADSALIVSIRRYYQYPDQINEIRKLFDTMLDIIRHGAYRSPSGEAAGRKV